MSLVSVLAGLTILSIVSYSAAHLTAVTKKAQIINFDSNSVSQSHLINLQKSKNFQVLKVALGRVGVTMAPGSPVANCLAGAGQNCGIFNDAQFRPLWRESHAISHNKTATTDVTYRMNCSSGQACDSVELKISTVDTNRNLQRTSNLRMSGLLFGDLPPISFACAISSGRFVTGIDFTHRQALCGGLPMTAGCNGQPITDLEAGSNPTCAAMTSLQCPKGIKKLGLIQDQTGVCL